MMRSQQPFFSFHTCVARYPLQARHKACASAVTLSLLKWLHRAFRFYRGQGTCVISLASCSASHLNIQRNNPNTKNP